MLEKLKTYLQSHQETFEATFTEEFLKEVSTIGHLIGDALECGNKVIFMGNGGSAADSQHLAAEFVSKLSIDRAPLAAIALTTDTSALTAIGNDYGFEKIFERQVLAVAREGDVLVGISTSGNSRNVKLGFLSGSKLGLTNIGLSGNKGFSDVELTNELVVQSKITAHIQEAHIFIGHLLCAIAEERFLK